MKFSLIQIVRSTIATRAAGYIGKLVFFIMLSLMLLAITFVESFDLMQPGEIFRFPNFLLLLFAPFVVAYIGVFARQEKTC